MQSQDLPLTSWSCLRGCQTSQASHPFSFTDLGLEMKDMALDGQKEMVSWCFHLTRDKPERIYGWIGNEIEKWGSPSDQWLQKDVVLVHWGPRWGLRHKWLNTKMTYGINGGSEQLHIHFPSLALLCTAEKMFGPHWPSRNSVQETEM